MIRGAVACCGAFLFVVSLGCGGLDFGDVSLTSVTEAQAVAAGFTPPAGSEQIYVQQHVLPDLTAVFMQVSLDSDEMEAAKLDIAARAEPEVNDGAGPPMDWPPLGPRLYDGASGPSWWTPDGETWVYERYAVGPSDVGVGNAWFIDERGGVISILSFQLEGWSLE